MKIKNTKEFNISLIATNKKVESPNGDMVLTGAPARVSIPAGSTIELTDKAWDSFKDAASPMLDSGLLFMVSEPKKSAAVAKKEKAAMLAEARKLVAEADGETKSTKKAKVVKAVEPEVVVDGKEVVLTPEADK